MDLFLEACGARGPLHLSVEYQGRAESTLRVLEQPFALIGRDPKADIVLKEGQVSRHHVYLQCLGGRLFCIDLESRTGTHWNRGTKRAGWLDPQQAIRIGPYWVRLLLGDPKDDSPTNGVNSGGGANGLPEVTLEFLNRGERTPTWRMTPMLALVGKAPECRVHLVGRSVANYHCSLVRTPLGLWVVDLLGPGGVWAQDNMVRCARLEDGDRLQVGKFMMRVHYESSTAALPPPAGDSHRLPTERSFGGLSFSQAGEAVAALESREESASRPTLLAPGSFHTPAVSDPPSHHDLVMLPPEQMALAGDASQHQLAPVLQQFGLMQQQMFDQFQQAMMMMFQMFSSMHRDQMGVIREELDRLQELTEEIQNLQAQLAKSAPGAQPAAAGAARPAPSAPKQVPLPPTPRSPSANDGPRKSSPSAPASHPTSGSNGTEANAGPPPSAQSQADIHAWLTHRLVAIQHERQTRWQKIVGFLTGKRDQE